MSTKSTSIGPIVAPVTTNTGMAKEFGIEKPPHFDGDQTKIKAFIQECNVYLNINENVYNTNRVKVAFVLSLMTEKEAHQWKTHYINQITGADMKINFPTFTNFLLILENDFQPADVAGDAMNQLELL